MKKLILLFLFFTFFSKISFSQMVDQRLEKKYSNKEINQIKDDLGHYHFLVYALDNACYTIDQPKGKDLSEFTEISLDIKSPLNFLDLGLEIKDQNQYFIIKGTNKLLVVKSNWVLNHELKTKK